MLEAYARFLAPLYDLFFLFLSFGMELRLREKVAKTAAIPSSYRILDLATGTGKQAFAFAKKGNEVIGVDFSRNMIELGQKGKSIDNLQFAISDATKLPFTNGSFDASCVSFALHDMVLSIRQKALGELVRVTKNNGTIIIVDYAVPKLTITRLFANIFRLFEPYYPEFISSDFEDLLAESGIQIENKIPVLLGAACIWKGRNNATEAIKGQKRQLF